MSKYTESLLPIFALCEGEVDLKLSVHIDTIAYFLIFLGVAIVGIGGIGVIGAMSEKQILVGMVTHAELEFSKLPKSKF